MGQFDAMPLMFAHAAAATAMYCSHSFTLQVGTRDIPADYGHMHTYTESTQAHNIL
jgi:hypothetical protein